MTITEFKKYKKYFNPEEFHSPDVPRSGLHMDIKFMDRLYKAREKADIAFRITSGFRSPAENKKAGGVLKSSHMKGIAVDIQCRDSHHRLKILGALVSAGFKRIGIAKTFIHCDTDKEKSECIWLY